MNGEVKFGEIYKVCLYECVRQMELKKEGERNGSSTGMLSTFERFVTVERIMEAVK